MLTHSTRAAFAALALSASVFAAAPALAEVASYAAALAGASETPPVDSKGTGMVDATYDSATKKLAWTITYTGLTGDATAAHFHGPAAPAAAAPPVVPISGPLASPIKGEATLTDAQAADVKAGKWYFNVHTAANKNGEIRGQLMTK